MSKILALLTRNFNIIFRSKSSSLIILLGPIIIMIAIGLAFSSQTNEQRVNVGYFSSDSNNNLTEIFTDLLIDDYSLNKYDSVNDCRQAISMGKEHICIIFPSNFEINNQKTNTIDFLVDNSNVNFFQSVVDSIEQKFNDRALDITLGMTQDLLNKLNNTNTEITNKITTLQDLEKANNDLLKLTQNTQKNINDIDTNFDKKNINLDDFNFDVLVSDTRKDTKDVISESLRIIDKFEDFVDDMKIITNETDDIEDSIEKAVENIETIDEEFESNYISSRTDFISKIDTIKDDLEKIESQFDQSTTKKAYAKKDIIALEKNLQESIKFLNEIKSTFASISSDINSTEITNLDVIVSPIKQNIKPVIDQEGQLNFYFPYLAILIIAFIGILLGASLVVMDKVTNANFRNFITPTNDVVFMFGTFLSVLSIIIFQMILVFLIYIFYFQKAIMDIISSLILVLLASATIFILIGMFVGNLVRSEETSNLIAIFITSLMIFVSDLIFPLEKMPLEIATLAQNYNPFYVTSSLLRKVLIHRMDVYFLQENFLILLLMILFLSLIVYFSYKFNKKHIILRFSGFFARRNVSRSVRENDLRKVNSRIENLSEEKYLKIDGDTKIKNLQELDDFIKKLNKDDFKKYVNAESNIFADWITNSLEFEHLGVKLYKTKSKNKISKLIHKKSIKLEKLKE
jgi:ABC-type multidrug transport system permease subunit